MSKTVAAQPYPPGRATRTDAPPARYLTVFQAAAYIGVTDRTIRQMVTDGRLTAYRLGGSVLRFRIEEIDAAFEAGSSR